MIIIQNKGKIHFSARPVTVKSFIGKFILLLNGLRTAGLVLFLFFLHCSKPMKTYTNPIIHADYSDPDVVAVDDDYYMTSSSFAHTPGLPVLHSRDLVNWEILGYALENLPDSTYNEPLHGKGVWAPAIRYHQGEFRIYYGDPDFGIYMVKSKKPTGPWEKPILVTAGKGLIDPCPFWDEDGKAYLLHAWAKSRAGFNSLLTLKPMNDDGTQVIGEGVLVFDGHENQPTIEGPKMYKRQGYYYIFAPAGGVKKGWQTVLRSKNIYGPYEDKILLEQGSTDINGPHQGAWIETRFGESWFIHFQDKDAYGRVVHLNPIRWLNDWPLMGQDWDGNGIGEPVTTYQRPKSSPGIAQYHLPTSDEFNDQKPGLQWQWEGNHSENWYSLSENPDNLRLYAQPFPANNLWESAAIIGQKFPLEEFDVIVKIESRADRAGLVILGSDYSTIALTSDSNYNYIQYSECLDADHGTSEHRLLQIEIPLQRAFLKIEVRKSAFCRFYYSLDGKEYKTAGPGFQARKGRWVGAKIGLYALGSGYADFDFCRINKHE
ncbi:MAG: glycoside hydrolase 43 family protein [Candidatus Marinimicrobia bacterium]|nr:glycoside hydrolase 43 family protein [Candidatus Neomarinimicrobiota bacterium]